MKTSWLINKGTMTIETFVNEYNKWMNFKPNIPVPFKDVRIAIKYKDKYSALSFCDDPEKYFVDRKLKQLIIRDAGIGDLLLLEPIIRKLHEKGNRNISVLTRYPEVYAYNPHIDFVHKMQTKENISSVKNSEYDSVDDLRSYSETHTDRRKKHRTDIYNTLFNLDIEDKEPRVYFDKKEKELLKKDKKKTYIGLSINASHRYRKYENADGLIQHILDQDKNNVVVLFDNVRSLQIKHSRIIDLQGKTSIRDAINYIRSLDYMIAVDSGLMHIALSLHIPTVCIFTIITADLRLRYYTGQYEVVSADIDCIGCGDWHMASCKKIGKEHSVAPCMDISPDHIYAKMVSMNRSNVSLKIYKNKKSKKVNINTEPKRKLKMPFMCQDEEHNIERFIDNVISHPVISECIAIDGGSKDKTVKILNKVKKVKVYTHPYLPEYHEMQAMQRNISCSYIEDGQRIIIMDPDECFSDSLYDYLYYLAEAEFEYGIVSRRTFKYYKDIKDPTKQIKDYPDYQPRFYIWNKRFKFVGGAHHQTLNAPDPVKIDCDILHFEEESGKRAKMEKQWAKQMSGVKALQGVK